MSGSASQGFSRTSCWPLGGSRRHFIICALLSVVAFPFASADSAVAPAPALVPEQRVEERGSPVEKMASRFPDFVKRNRAGDVVGLDVVTSFADINDRDIAALKDLPKLADLMLQVVERKSSLTDEGLKSLGELKSLRKATIVSCGSLPGRSAVEAIGSLPQLKELQLTLAEFAGAPHVLDDELMASLRNLSSLEVLRITQSSNLGNRDLEWVEKAGSLRILSLTVDRLSAKEMHRLAGLRELQELRLYTNRFDPAAVRELSKLGKLKSLDLTSDDLSTDGFADALLKLPNLRHVRLHGKKIDSPAIRELQKAIPAVNVRN